MFFPWLSSYLWIQPKCDLFKEVFYDHLLSKVTHFLHPSNHSIFFVFYFLSCISHALQLFFISLFILFLSPLHEVCDFILFFFSTKNSGWYRRCSKNSFEQHKNTDGIQGNKARENHVPKFKCEPKDSWRGILFATRRNSKVYF